MRKSWLLCVLLGALAWGQSAPAPAPGQPMQAPAAPPDLSASVPADAPVITVNGVCPSTPKAAAPKPPSAAAASKAPAAPKTSSADCKTVITKAEFEKLANGVSPNITPQLKKQLANVLPRLIAMSTEAKKKGLDKSPRYEETVKFAKMQILTNELQRSIQEEGSKVPPEQIAAYFKQHPDAFEQYNLDRIFVPRSKQDTDDDDKPAADKDEKLTEEQQKAKQEKEKAEQEAGEQAMSKLAENLRSRAAAGEDVMKLQKEAFDAAGMKIESPTVNLPKVRRTGLPPAHAAVFELKPGDVSQVISDSGGHYIYKVNSKDALTLDQAKDEIHNTLQTQRTRELMDKANPSPKVDMNPAYFGPAGAAMQPGGPMGGRPMPAPGQRMTPSPMAPPPQTPTPAQPPAVKPN
jgi:bifunctional DNA-binding transcriptional regulator/antitoxin component of YhaV-PrlF toxin-antitoxin module